MKLFGTKNLNSMFLSDGDGGVPHRKRATPTTNGDQYDTKNVSSKRRKLHSYRVKNAIFLELELF